MGASTCEASAAKETEKGDAESQAENLGRVHTGSSLKGKFTGCRVVGRGK